jgi:hypothetical protein
LIPTERVLDEQLRIFTDMRISQVRSSGAVPVPRGEEHPDGVAVVVVAVVLVWFVLRVLIPSLIDGDQVGMTLLTCGLLTASLGIALLPAWRRRRARGSLGRL